MFINPKQTTTVTADENNRKTTSATNGSGGKKIYNENKAETNEANSFRENFNVVFCENWTQLNIKKSTIVLRNIKTST